MEYLQPAFGASEEKLELFISRGIINWGEPVQGEKEWKDGHVEG